MRALSILTDLTERGRRIVLDVRGTDYVTLNRNWNGGSEFSMMLPRSLFHDLYVWCLISDGIDEIIVSDEGVCGRTDSDSDDEWTQFYESLVHFDKHPRRIWPVGGPRRGTRMVHAMSGRSE